MTKLTKFWALAMLHVVLLLSLGWSLAEDKMKFRVTSGKAMLLSFSGFRWDYVDQLPENSFFRKIKKEGSRADYVHPIFPTLQIPALYSIATGLYAESHGIVGQFMYDPTRKEYFNPSSNNKSYWWDGGEPLWVTAVRHNKKAGVIFWPGCHAEIRGFRPTRCVSYNDAVSMPYENIYDVILQKLMQWLQPSGMDLIMVSYPFPDKTGHKFGPESKEVIERVEAIGIVLEQAILQAGPSKLRDINIIITSDHGMASVDPKTKLLDLYDYVDERNVAEVLPGEAFLSIIPEEGRYFDVYKALKNMPHATVYRKQDIPEEFHLKNNDRVYPILLVLDEGWMVSTPVNEMRADSPLKGMHGYSNALPSMRTVFFAQGPDFTPGKCIPNIRSVDIYPFMCALLNIEPAPNNGSLRKMLPFLTEHLYMNQKSTGGAERLALHSSLSWMCLGLMALRLISCK